VAGVPYKQYDQSFIELGYVHKSRNNGLEKEVAIKVKPCSIEDYSKNDHSKKIFNGNIVNN